MTNNNNRLKTYKEIFSMTAKDFQDLLKQNTDTNYHTENVLYLAFRSGNKKFIEEAKLVLADHLSQGSLSHENAKRRTELLSKIKSTFLATYQKTYWECL